MRAGLAVAFLLAALAFVSPLAAQNEKAVAWALSDAPKTVKRGAKFNVKVTAQVTEGWHLYSMAQAEGGPIPTRVWLPDGQPFSPAGELRVSKPKVKFDENFGMNVEYYERAAEFVVPARAPADAAPGAGKLAVNASFQACNDKLCLPPRTVKLTADIEVR